jgi:hypothetical protein
LKVLGFLIGKFSSSFPGDFGETLELLDSDVEQEAIRVNQVNPFLQVSL